MRRLRRRRAGYSSNYVAPHKRYKKNKRNARPEGARAGFLGAILGGIAFVGNAFARAIAWPFQAVSRLLHKGGRRAGIGVGPTKPGIAQEVTPLPTAAQTQKTKALHVLHAPHVPHAPRAARASGGLGGLILAAVLLFVTLASGGFLYWALCHSDKAITVYINENGFRQTILTKAETVDELFSLHKITLREDDAVNYALGSSLLNGMEITIESTFPVAVASKGDVSILRMRQGSVGDALELAGINYSAGDEITKLTFEDVQPGMHIQHIDVETRYETVDQAIPYKEEVIRDSSQYTDYNRVKVAGENGTKRIVRRLVYKDGELSSREIMNQIVLKEAVDEIKILGTKIKYQTNFSGETREWRPKPTSEQIKKTIVATEITAYTHTGRKTATGRWPKLGYVAVNPNVIPYGTKLYIPGYGYCTAQDTGAFRHEEGGMKNQIDIFLNTEKECKSWGRKRNVTIYILK